MKQITAALYVRVSTQDQKLDLQVRELREYCARVGWAVVEYPEKASSVKHRPVLERLMEDARMRRFQVAMVWKMDRFGRSLKQLMGNIELLDSYGIRFIALTQSIDTDKQNPMGRLMLQLFGAFAEFERAMIVDRVNSGLAAARAKGVVGGRPRRVFPRGEVERLRKTGLSCRAIALKFGVSKSLVANVLKGVH